MKKEYINPEMFVVKMQTMTVLAASDPVDTVDTENPVTPGTEDATRWFDNGGSEDW